MPYVTYLQTQLKPLCISITLGLLEFSKRVKIYSDLLHYIQPRMEKVHYSLPYLIYVDFCNKVQATAIFFLKKIPCSKNSTTVGKLQFLYSFQIWVTAQTLE